VLWEVLAFTKVNKGYEAMREHVISFRVDWNEYGEIEKQASQRGEELAEWCRNLVLSESAKDFGLTASERILLEEISVLRKMLGVLAAEILPPKKFSELRKNVNEHYEEYGRQVLEKRAGARVKEEPDGAIEEAIERV
jgi:hypothetical protein